MPSPPETVSRKAHCNACGTSRLGVLTPSAGNAKLALFRCGPHGHGTVYAVERVPGKPDRIKALSKNQHLDLAGAARAVGRQVRKVRGAATLAEGEEVEGAR